MAKKLTYQEFTADTANIDAAKFQKLFSEYDMGTGQQYFDMVIDSHINGQLKQAAEQFRAMPHRYRKELVKDCLNMGMTEQYNFFFKNL